MKNKKKQEQAGAELWQAQLMLGLAKVAWLEIQ